MYNCETGYPGGLIGLLASTVGISLTIELDVAPLSQLTKNNFSRLDLLGMDAQMAKYPVQTAQGY